MVQAKGSSAQLLFGPQETTFGTTPGTPSAYNLPIISADISDNRALIDPKDIRGRRDAAAPGQGNSKPSGSANVSVDTRAIGFWLAMVMGMPTTTGIDPYTHVFQIGDTVPSFPIDIGFTDISRYNLFNGVKANSINFKFDAAADSNLEATIALEAAKETAGTTPLDAAPTTLDFARFNIGDLTLEEGGVSIANVTAVDFSINNNLDTNQYVVGGGGVRGALSEGIVAVTGNITALFENDTLLAKARSFTESSLTATLTSGTDSLEIKINELRYGYKSPGITGPQGILITLPFTAYFDDNGTDETAIQATLVNDFASYE